MSGPKVWNLWCGGLGFMCGPWDLGGRSFGVCALGFGIWGVGLVLEGWGHKVQSWSGGCGILCLGGVGVCTSVWACLYPTPSTQDQ